MRGALESFDRTLLSENGKEAHKLRVTFFSGAATTSQNSYTFLFPPIRFADRAVISYSVPKQKRVLGYGLNLEPLGETANAAPVNDS